jgi:chemotaxis protein CheD
LVAAPVLVGMAELQAITGAALLTCLGLGSCVSVCALDPVANVSGMAHIMLPTSFADQEVDRPAKFADTGIRELVSSMEKLGAIRQRLVVAVAGGANVKTSEELLNIGKRNADAVIEQLQALGVRCVACDLGGHLGRTVTMSSDSGKVVVRTTSKGEDVLCTLRG